MSEQDSASQVYTNILRLFVPIVSIGICKNLGITDSYQITQITVALTFVIGAIKIENIMNKIYIMYCRTLKRYTRSDKNTVYIYENVLYSIFKNVSGLHDIVLNTKYINMLMYLGTKEKCALIDTHEDYDKNDSTLNRYSIVLPKHYKQSAKLYIRDTMGTNKVYTDTYKGCSVQITFFPKPKFDQKRNWNKDTDVYTPDTMNHKLSHFKCIFSDASIIEDYFKMVDDIAEPNILSKKDKIYNIQFIETHRQESSDDKNTDTSSSRT